MTYQVLARKWRPQDFSAIIGQEPIVTALRNALREGRIAQAYLFAGIRGVGKTTAARVLAKALNCENGPAEDPCNACATCTGITSGADLDVLEIDAATYSKVEQVRELTESLKYGPANDRYKVVVLDEIHRLSRQAFDALLKIVEEPPPHLTFIFATTEVDAVPATILSRCQEFHFRRVPAGILAAHLETLCAAENITASSTALRLIARAGEGSVRDSVALLDQLATFGNGAIDDDEAVRLLGGLDIQLFEQTLRAVFAGDHSTIATVVHEIEDRGWDPRSAFTQLLAYCRDGLHLATRSAAANGEGAEEAGVELPGEAVATLRGLVQEAGFENLLRLVHLLLGSELTIKRSEMPGLALEVALLRAAELPKLRQVEQLLRDGGEQTPPAGSPAAGGGRNRAAAKSQAVSAQQTSRGVSQDTAATAGAARAENPSAAGTSEAPPNDAAAKQAFLAHLRSKPSLAAHLDDILLKVDTERFAMVLPNDDDVVATLFEHHLAFLEEGARACSGASARVVLERSTRRPALPRAATPDDGGDPSSTSRTSPDDAATNRASPSPSRATAGAQPTAKVPRTDPEEGATDTPKAALGEDSDVPASDESAPGEKELPPAVAALVEVFGGRVLSHQEHPAEDGVTAPGESR